MRCFWSYSEQLSGFSLTSLKFSLCQIIFIWCSLSLVIISVGMRSSEAGMLAQCYQWIHIINCTHYLSPFSNKTVQAYETYWLVYVILQKAIIHKIVHNSSYISHMVIGNLKIFLLLLLPLFMALILHITCHRGVCGHMQPYYNIYKVNMSKWIVWHWTIFPFPCQEHYI